MTIDFVKEFDGGFSANLGAGVDVVVEIVP